MALVDVEHTQLPTICERSDSVPLAIKKPEAAGSPFVRWLSQIVCLCPMQAKVCVEGLQIRCLKIDDTVVQSVAGVSKAQTRRVACSDKKNTGKGWLRLDASICRPGQHRVMFIGPSAVQSQG